MDIFRNYIRLYMFIYQETR